MNNSTFGISTHIVEYDLAIKRSESIHATTWMDCKGIILTEKSQSQDYIYYMILFILHSQMRKYRGEEKISGSRVWRKEWK